MPEHEDADREREPSFAAAVEAARQGDRDALGELFRAFHPRVLRYLRARHAAIADDIAGEVWVAVAQRIGAFEGDGAAFSAWIFTIARQRLADHHRMSGRRRTDPVAEVAAVAESQDGRASTRRPTEDEAIEVLDAQAAVDLIARVLSPDQSEVVLLRTLGGLSAADVARVMSRPETWVRVTHHRALRRLSTRLAPQKL